MNNEHKYLIYCTNKNPQFPSCDDQESWMVQMAESQEINVIGTFRDISPSIKQFNLLLQVINRKEAQGIIVWDISLIPQIPLTKKLIRTNKIHAIKPFLDA